MEIERYKKWANRWIDDLLSKRFGEMDDYMMILNLMRESKKIGFIFTKAGQCEITDPKHGICRGVDDIDDHIERMEKLRRYADLHDDDSEKAYAFVLYF
jgi:hypothetical protein